MTEKNFFNDLHRRIVHHVAAQRLHRAKEEAIWKEIQGLAVETGARFHLVADFSKRLEEPLRISRAFFSETMHRVPGPVGLDPDHWDTDPCLNAVFVNVEEIRSLISGVAAIQQLFAEQADLSQAFGLLVTQRRQKTVLTAVQEGQLLRRDVARKSVYFENHRIMAVAPTLARTHELARHQGLTALVVRTLKEIQGLKQWKAELEKQHEMLELLVRLPAVQPEEAAQQREARQVLDQIHDQLNHLDTGIGSPDDQLARMAFVLTHPEQYLKMQLVRLRLNRMGLEVNGQADGPVNEITLAEFTLDETQSQVAFWVAVDRSAMPQLIE